MLQSVTSALRVASAEAWKVGFVSGPEKLLSQQIRSAMQGFRRKTGFYWNHVSVIQSSGTGKSRTVDEVAKEMFSIPLNVRRNGSGKPDSPICRNDAHTRQGTHRPTATSGAV